MDFTEKHLTFQPAQLQNTIIFHYTSIADKFQYPNEPRERAKGTGSATHKERAKGRGSTTHK